MTEQQRERDIAEMEAQMAHDTDQYFEARPQIMRTRDKETTFEAGFKAAWEARALSHAEGEAVEIEAPEFHAEGMGCGLEDRGITDRYEAMEYGFNEAVEQYEAIIEGYGQLYTHPAPQVAVPEGWREEFDQFWDAQTGGRNEWTTLERLAALDAWQHAIEWVVQHGRAPTAPAGEAVPWPAPQEATTIEEYVSEYEYTDGEGYNYSPTETERALILDAIHGIPDHLLCSPPAAQQPVSDPDGLPEARGYWLKDSGYGIDDQFDTLEEALSAAFGLIEEYRIEAGADEWPSDAGSITISTVTHVAKFVHVRENEFDLRMEAVAPAPDERDREVAGEQADRCIGAINDMLDEREIAAKALEHFAAFIHRERPSPSWAESEARKRAARLRAGKEGEDHE